MTRIATKELDQLTVEIYTSNEQMGQAAAVQAAEIIQEAVAERGAANVVLATGNSQSTFLAALRVLPEIPWPAVNVFHLDEYVQLTPGHKAGFSLTLRDKLIDHVRVGNFFPVPGAASDLEAACNAYALLLRAYPADLCCLGIGENGHLAFNEPGKTRFDDPQWVKIVRLTEASRRQQVGEGHFLSIEETPAQAITLTIPAIRAARRLLAIVPEARKAPAVVAALTGPIHGDCPASILRETAHARLYLDVESGRDFLG